jgi:hypothetical protein
MDRDIRGRRPWPTGDPIRQGNGFAGRRTRCNRGQAGACPRIGRRRDGNCEISGRGERDCQTNRRRRAWCAGDGRVAAGFQKNRPSTWSGARARSPLSACLPANSHFRRCTGKKTIRGSIVGGRQDLAEAIAFAQDSKVSAHIHKTTLENINQVITDLRNGNVDGRMVVTC